MTVCGKSLVTELSENGVSGLNETQVSGLSEIQVSDLSEISHLDVHDPKVSPIYGDMTGLCPMTLYVGTREILYPDIIRLGETLSRQEAEFVLHVGKGMNHVYPFYPIPEAGKVFKEVVSLISDGF